MYQTEYVRSMQCNYVRFMLPEKPQERRFQYCMLCRGGMKGLLECSLRYLDGSAYLYYDITSKQNITQFFQRGVIDRKWLKDFVESIKQVKYSLERFLLVDNNVIWHPNHVFQDLEKNEFSYIYVPYYEGENQFLELLSFFVEHIDYEDDKLVECVYRMYEQYEKNGDVYLQEQIFKDVDSLSLEGQKKDNLYELPKQYILSDESLTEGKQEERNGLEVFSVDEPFQQDMEEEEVVEKKGLFSLFENRREKAKEKEGTKGNAKGESGKTEKELRASYKEMMHRRMQGYMVAEESTYGEEEDFGRTMYLSPTSEKRESIHRLYSADGAILAQVDKQPVLIGKVKEKVDLYLEDASVSRMHAKVYKKDKEVILEDLNSTNGTFVNGRQLQPYEKGVLQPGDEVRCANAVMFYR